MEVDAADTKSESSDEVQEAPAGGDAAAMAESNGE
jgi:hypothetical protein